MKQGRVSMILGILFGICLLPIAYMCLALGIALAFSGNRWFGSLMYVFAVLGVVTIIASCFAKKKPLLTVIINGTSALVLLAVIIYLVAETLLTSNISLLLMLIAIEVLGILSVVFAGVAIKKLQNLSIKGDNVQQ